MSFQLGDVAYFDFLHLQCATEKESNDDEDYSYVVPGKMRPMLVLSESGPEWFLLLYVTSQPPKPEHENFYFPTPLPSNGGLSKPSYVQISPLYRYPVCLARKKRAEVDCALLQSIYAMVRPFTGHAPPQQQGQSIRQRPLVPGSDDDFELPADWMQAVLADEA